MARTRPSGAAEVIMLTFQRLFKLDNVTRMASVELWVLLTTLLLVVRFLVDFWGPWFANPRRTFFVLTLELLNQTMVIYTMGLMQLSGASKVNDYFQVWAVLLVTLQYSVKTGRPYTRSKQVPLLDLMSSFWSANLLRVQTFYLLRFPLWTIWFLNSVRIITLFVSSGKGETINQESMRLVSDYMRYEGNVGTLDGLVEQEQEQHEKKKSGSRTINFDWRKYKYLVYGEHRVLKQVREQESYEIQLDPDGAHKEQLVTLETIWRKSKEDGSGLLGGSAAGRRRRDLCLSFALYKLLRRRFFDLPMHEHDKDRPADKQKMRRLVLDYVLEGWGQEKEKSSDPNKPPEHEHGHDPERAFRITGTELSFLRDLFYSKHATVFAGGILVPLRCLLLSLCMATATGYIAYPARYIPERMDPADRNRITHGVFITRLMVAIIVLKELLEILLYLGSSWAEVMVLCKYAQLQHRRPAVEAAAKPVRWFVLCFRAFSSCVSMLCRCFRSFLSSFNKQRMTVHQQNLLVAVRVLMLDPLHVFTMRMLVIIRGERHGQTGLEDYVKDAIFHRLKRLEKEEAESSRKEAAGTIGKAIVDDYFSNAFGSESEAVVKWPCNLSQEVDTHIILVWHIATSLCEIDCFNRVKKFRAAGRRPWGPFMHEPITRHRHTRKGPAKGSSSAPPAGQSDERASWSQQYATAVTLSNYCVYLVSKSLVPDNGLVARKVLDEVIREVDYVIVGDDKSRRVKILASLRLGDVSERLMKTVDKPCSKNPPDDEEAPTPSQEEEKKEGSKDDDEDLDIGCSLTRMGAVLAKELKEVYRGSEDRLWEDLATFWTGFLLHLAANTGAATHGKHLAGNLELITHLWALLTHAGYRGNAVHGEQGLDQDDNSADTQQAAA